MNKQCKHRMPCSLRCAMHGIAVMSSRIFVTFSLSAGVDAKNEMGQTQPLQASLFESTIVY